MSAQPPVPPLPSEPKSIPPVLPIVGQSRPGGKRTDQKVLWIILGSIGGLIILIGVFGILLITKVILSNTIASETPRAKQEANTDQPVDNISQPPNTLLPFEIPAAKVNNTIITVDQFEKRVKYERFLMIRTFLQYATSPFGVYFQSQLLTVQNQLDNYVQYGSDVLDIMISETLGAQMAAEKGIIVTDSELAQNIQESFGYFPNGTPTPAPPDRENFPDKHPFPPPDGVGYSNPHCHHVASNGSACPC
jgi:hypothetical protein